MKRFHNSYFFWGGGRSRIIGSEYIPIGLCHRSIYSANAIGRGKSILLSFICWTVGGGYSPRKRTTMKKKFENKRKKNLNVMIFFNNDEHMVRE